MALLAFLVLFLAMAGHSTATYCLCKDGGTDPVYQKVIDYACGNGADCTAIQQSGGCYNPNNVKAHCDYAANSYFQNKNEAGGTCNFNGVAAPSANPPTTIVTGCSFPNSPGNTGTPTTGTGTTGTGTTGTTTGTGTGTTTGSTTGGTTGGVFNSFGPSSSTFGDPSGVERIQGKWFFLFVLINLFLMWA